MNEWMNNPALDKLDPIKQELIRTAAKQTQGKNGKSLAPVMLLLISNASKRGISFSNEEISLILDVLKDGKSPEEIQKINHMIQMTRNLMKNPPKSNG